MALTVNTNIINDTDQYLIDAKNVKGTYVVVATATERDSLPAATRMNGSLCYCQEDSKFYQYDGKDWVEKGFGGYKYGTEESPYDIGLQPGDIYFSASTRNYVSWVEDDKTIHTVHSGTGWSRENNACVLNSHHNTATGAYSVAVNSGTRVSGDYSIASGVDTDNESPRSFVGGWLSHNYPSAVHSFNFGYRNNCYGKNTAIFGTDNTSYDGSDHAFVCGNECKVYGTESLSGGYQSITGGSKAVAFGSQCLALNDCSVAIGERVIASGIGSFACGGSSSYPRSEVDTIIHTNNNDDFEAAETEVSDYIDNQTNSDSLLAAIGNYSAAFGYNNLARHAHSAAFGRNNKTTREQQLVCGIAASPNSNALFTVGNGTVDNSGSVTSRGNAFEVLYSGGIKIGSATLTAANVTALLDQLNKYQIVTSLPSTAAEGTICIVTG